MVSSSCPCQRLPGFKVCELVQVNPSDAFAQPYCILQATKINYSTCDVEDLEFDRDVSMPSWAKHPRFLIPQKAVLHMFLMLKMLTSRCVDVSMSTVVLFQF